MVGVSFQALMTASAAATTPFALDFVTSSTATDLSDLTTYTFTSIPIGTADTNRIVIVAIAIGGVARTVSSATIGGIAASIAGTTTGTTAGTGMIYAKVPTGTTATISITLSGAANDCHIGVYRLVGQGSDTPFDTDAPAGGGTTTRTATLDVPAGGAVVACMGNGGSNVAWTNATEDYDINTGGNSFSSAAHQAYATLQTGLGVQCTSCRAIVAASWGP